MESSYSNRRTIQRPVGPRRASIRPRSTSQHSKLLDPHRGGFDGWTPPFSQPRAVLGQGSSFEHSLVLLSSDDVPPALAPGPLVSSSVYRHRTTSQTSLHSNPAIERTLARPSLLRTTPRSRTPTSKASRPSSNSKFSGERKHIAEATSHSGVSPGNTLSKAKGRTAFYHDLAAKAEPALGRKPRESRRLIPASVVQERKERARQSTQGHSTGGYPHNPKFSHNRGPHEDQDWNEKEQLNENLPSSKSKTLPRLSAVGYASDDSESSSCKLSLPVFYSNPKATSSEGTLASFKSADAFSPQLSRAAYVGTRVSVDTLRSVDTAMTIDTMSMALRSLGPASTPTIEQLPPSLSRRGDANYRRSLSGTCQGGNSSDVVSVAPLRPKRALKDGHRACNLTAKSASNGTANKRSSQSTLTKSLPENAKRSSFGANGKRSSVDTVNRRSSQDATPRPASKRLSRVSNGSNETTSRVRNVDAKANSSRHATLNPNRLSVSQISGGLARTSSASSPYSYCERMETVHEQDNGGQKGIKRSAIDQEGGNVEGRDEEGIESGTRVGEKRKEGVETGKIDIKNIDPSSPADTRASFDTAPSTFEEVKIKVEALIKETSGLNLLPPASDAISPSIGSANANGSAQNSMAPKSKLSKKREHMTVPPPLSLIPAPSTNYNLSSPTRYLSSPNYKPFHSRASSDNSLLSPSAMSIMSSTSTIAPIVGPRPPTERELRRRRFLKLTRTLGEDIPPELLVGNCTGQQVRDSLILQPRKEKGDKGRERERAEKKRRNSVSFPTVDPLMEALLLAAPGEIFNNPHLHYQVTGISPKRYNTHMKAAMDPSDGGAGGGRDGSQGRAGGLRDSNPNVLRKNNSLRKKNGVSLVDSLASTAERDDNEKVAPTPAPSPDRPAPLAIQVETVSDPVPYFEDHPFRIIVEDIDSSASPISPAPLTTLQGRRGVYADNRIGRDEIPWRRASLSLPWGDDTPFIDYAVAVHQPPHSQYQSPFHHSPTLPYTEAQFPQYQQQQKRNSCLTVPDVVDSTGIYRREKRQGWSGEWNQPHIQDVIEKLRNL